MKTQVALILLGAVAFVLARPTDDVVDIDTDNMSVEQEGIPGKAVEGSYSWVAPNGQEFEVQYTADHRGFRVHETDAVATFRDVGMPAEVQEDGEEPEIADDLAEVEEADEPEVADALIEEAEEPEDVADDLAEDEEAEELAVRTVAEEDDEEDDE